MKVLSLDISTKSGWAVFSSEGEDFRLLSFGVVAKSKKNVRAYGKYPLSYARMAEEMAQGLFCLVKEHRPDVIVIEETNNGKSRYTQKTLEHIHCRFLALVERDLVDGKYDAIYVSSSSWRRACGIALSKEEKKKNAALAKAKRDGVSKQSIGITGKVTKKHLAVRLANDQFKLSLKMKDNDIAEAILLAWGWKRGASVCDGMKEHS